jgi:putative transposase
VIKLRKASHCVYKIRYHMVFCVKYGRKLLRDADRINYLKSVCSEIGERYWFEFDAIGTDGDHVHIFVGAAPRYSPSAISIAVTVAAFQMQALGRFWGIFPQENWVYPYIIAVAIKIAAMFARNAALASTAASAVSLTSITSARTIVHQNIFPISMLGIPML